MTVEAVLQEVRRIVGTRAPGHPAVQRGLAALANRAGVAPILLRTAENGPLVDAQLAALALPHVTGELVRRAIVRAAKGAEGDRRTVLLASLTEDELAKVVPRGAAATQEAVLASGLLALNDPAGFVAILCERRRVVSEALVEQVERVRDSYGLGAASVYGPLLDRNLSPEARARVLAILGRIPGDPVRALLEAEEKRAPNPEAAKVARRERMRQGALDAAPRKVSGTAFLAVPALAEVEALEIFETLENGRFLRTSVMIPVTGEIERFTTPVEANAGPATFASQSRWSPISLGNARALLETLPAKRRAVLSPLLERLAAVTPEPVPVPAPTTPPSAGAARALVAQVPWSEWRPFTRIVRWPASLLDEGRDTPVEAWPPHEEALGLVARERLAAALARPGVAAALAAGMRRMALHLQLRGDSRAGAVAGEAVLVARKRATTLAAALTERELRIQLRQQAVLPDAYRADVRERLRQRLGETEVGWAEVQRLDLAQVAAEAEAREKAENGLPAAESLDFDAALKLADKAQASLAEPGLRRRAKSKRLEVVAEAARGWLDGAPVAVVSNLARFAAETCLAGCPHRCFERSRGSSADKAWNAPCPEVTTNS